jgi:hypothetical protein
MLRWQFYYVLLVNQSTKASQKTARRKKMKAIINFKDLKIKVEIQHYSWTDSKGKTNFSDIRYKVPSQTKFFKRLAKKLNCSLNLASKLAVKNNIY